MGVVRAALAAVWAKGLIVQTGKMPLDCEMDHPVVGKIREVIRMDCDPGTTGLTDLYVWRVGEQVHSCALSVVTQDSARLRHKAFGKVLPFMKKLCTPSSRYTACNQRLCCWGCYLFSSF